MSPACHPEQQPLGEHCSHVGPHWGKLHHMGEAGLSQQYVEAALGSFRRLCLAVDLDMGNFEI